MYIYFLFWHRIYFRPIETPHMHHYNAEGLKRNSMSLSYQEYSIMRGGGVCYSIIGEKGRGGGDAEQGYLPD